MMRTGLAMVFAYITTALVVPVLFVGMFIVSPIPLPRGFLFGSVANLFLTTAWLTLIVGLPGYAVGRFVLWWGATKSPFAFALAGALAGWLAAVALCLPDHLWVLRRHDVDFFGAGIGAVAGLIYLQIERRLARTTPTRRKSMEFGVESR